MDVANDINGDFFVAGQQGEIEEDLSYRHVVVQRKNRDIFRLGVLADVREQQVIEAVVDTIKANYWFCLANPRNPNEVLTSAQARRVAFLRVCGLIMGLGDTENNPRAHNVTYNDVKIIDNATEYEVEGVVHRVDEDVPEWADDSEWRAKTRKKVTDMVCNIAFEFRTRGHHYLDDMKERYEHVWQKCLYEEDTPGLSWRILAHTVFHFIYPDVLDAFWVSAASNERCAGALIKRLNSFAAGTASIGAVATGLEDLTLVFPRMRELLTDAYAEVGRCVSIVRADNGRWAGSINRRYYGAGDLIIDERVISAAAAVTVAALAGIATDSPLRNSEALKRVARNAPITGTVLSQIITKATQHDRMVLAILPEGDDAD